VDLVKASDFTIFRATWTAVEVEGENLDGFLDETELAGGDNILAFLLSNSKLCLIGGYNVSLYLNDEFDWILEFEVK
jgi:hypothetical protein